LTQEVGKRKRKGKKEKGIGRERRGKGGDAVWYR
jgi:hypothetical protein